MTRLWGPLSLAAAIVLVVAGCGAGGNGSAATASSTATEAPVVLNVAAAASLKTAIARLTEAYTAANPGVSFTVTTDSSAALRTQVEQGAPIDVFLSADTKNPQALTDSGLAAAAPVAFAANTVALVVPVDNPAGIRTPEDLSKPGLALVAAGEKVPITAYADEVVANIARSRPDPTTWAAAVDANIVSREENVAAVLARVELGEGDAGFVYATDAAGSDKVATIEIPAAANVRATYAGVVPEASKQADAAAVFLAWIAGPEGQAVLRPLGFLAP